MERSRPFVRNFAAGELLEIFFVSAISAVIAIRFYLEATGFPRVGGDNLHIAHMLWGGLFMLIAIVILITFLSDRSMRLAATLGGLGFGTFIDEVGKFVTHENDYFFRPAIAIIYVTFILVFIFVRTLRRRTYRRDEYLLNAIEALREVAQHDLDPDEQRVALEYLNESDPDHPMVPPLRALLEEAPLVPASPGYFARSTEWLRDRYRVLVIHRWFRRGIVAFFVGQFLVRLFLVIALVKGFRAGALPEVSAIARSLESGLELGFVAWSQLGSTLFSGVLVLMGIVTLSVSNLRAYLWWKRSVLVTLLITQVFVFYTDQLSGLLGLALNGLLLFALDIAIRRERELERDDNPLV
jgi:hypothetical protein